MKKTLALVAVLLIAACSDADTACRVLEIQGFTDIETTGWSLFGCSNDIYHTGFIATAPNGARVKGVVCSDWFKGATVRLF